MRILQILPALNQGGVEHCVLENASHLVAAGHESIVISSGGRLVARLEEEGSSHITLPIHKKSLWTFLQVPTLRRTIEDLNPDIVHVHSRLQAWLCYFVMRKIRNRGKIRYITNVHGFNSVNFYSEIMLAGDKVVLESEAVRSFIELNYPKVSKERLTVIPLGVDTERFNRDVDNTEVKARLTEIDATLDTAKIVTIVGRITRIKGHHHFIELIAQLKKEIPSVKGLIVGDYDEKSKHYYEELIKQITEKELHDTVFFYGHCTDMPALYKSVDLTVSLTTKPESYGRTILESLACGTPVIGFDQGGVGENLAKYYPAGNAAIDDFDDIRVKAKSALFEPNEIPLITESLAAAQARLQQLYSTMINE